MFRDMRSALAAALGFVVVVVGVLWLLLWAGGAL
jgi:hypothetical protein